MKMNKTVIATAVAVTMGLGISGANAAAMTSASFVMLTAGGAQGNPDGDDTTVTGSIGGGAWSVASTTLFSGSLWATDSGTTFGPGTYTFDTMEGGTPNPLYTGIVVGAGQVGGHILFNWGAANASTSCGQDNCGIDVVNVWDVATAGGVTTYTSTDVAANRVGGNGIPSVLGPDGVLGLQMIDGPFKTFNANFNFTTAVPVPAAVWLFGSGLLGLVGVARRKKTA